jgi:molybdate transport system ATP-binding protein
MTLSADVVVVRGALRVHAALGAEDGETVALLGPNGSGKSTIVACLAGLLPPDEGTIALDGRTLDDPRAGTHVPPEDRPVGVVFQDGILFPHLSAVENVAFPLRARGVVAPEARARAHELLDHLSFPVARADARPGDLSGGEAQRVAIARALIHEPRLLLMDEPTSSLDVRARSELRPLIRSTLDGFDGVRVLVTHDPVEALTLADRIVILEDGKVTQSGTPEQLRNAPRTAYVADLVGVNLFAGRLEPLDVGAGSVVTSSGSVVVPWPDDLPREPVDGVLAVLRPSDVALHTSRPEGSARNVVDGRIAEIAIEGQRARVRLAGAPAVVAEVTLGSVDRLGLREGGTVWASFKAVEVTLVLP